MNGGAAVDACTRIRERMAQVAAANLGRVAQALLACAVRGGQDKSVCPTSSSRTATSTTIAIPGRDTRGASSSGWSYLQRVSLGERGFYSTKGIDWDADSGVGSPFLYFTQGAAVSEVEVDRFTGAMRILRSDLLMDIGKSINPGIDRGQITGAFVQGAGWLTNEELRYAGQRRAAVALADDVQDPEHRRPARGSSTSTPSSTRRTRSTSAAARRSASRPLLLGISVFMAVKNALRFVSGGEIPKIKRAGDGRGDSDAG